MTSLAHGLPCRGWGGLPSLIEQTERNDPMKVRITFTVDVDADAWMANYGVDRRDVPNDVRAWAHHGIVSQLEEIGALAHNHLA